MNRDDLLQLQASFNRNAPRRARKTEPVVEPIELPSDEDGVFDIKNFVAVDCITNHVLVEFDEPGYEWQPYLYLRRACPTLRNKADLDNDVARLKLSPHESHFAFKPREPINNFHDIVPLAYVPWLLDGTEHGKHELIVYRLKGKAAIGITTRSSIVVTQDFIDGRRAMIAAAGTDEARLAEVMGMNLNIVDMCNPFAGGYRFKNFSFLAKLKAELLLDPSDNVDESDACKSQSASSDKPAFSSYKSAISASDKTASDISTSSGKTAYDISTSSDKPASHIPATSDKRYKADPFFTYANAMLRMQVVMNAVDKAVGGGDPRPEQQVDVLDAAITLVRMGGNK
jgi:hypothetical protein